MFVRINQACVSYSHFLRLRAHVAVCKKLVLQLCPPSSVHVGQHSFLTHSTVFLALVARCAVSLFRVVSFVRLSCLSLGFSICCSITSTPLSRVACSDYVLPCLACLLSCLVCRLSPLLTIVTLVARPPNSRNLASSQTAPVFTCRVVVLHHGHLPVSRITSSVLSALAHPHATLTSKNIARLSVIEASPAV